VQIYPAIDLRGGRCVRLRQGDYNKETEFSDDPAAMARRWVDAGAAWLHLVDLDGAKEGRPINGDSVRRIVEAAGVPCQLGGGLRTEEHITQALGWGVRVCQRFPEQIVLGIDAKHGLVATDGWLKTSSVSAVDLARQSGSWPLAAIVYTDISKDGMLSGPDFDGLAAMVKAVRLPVIASGGITTLQDIRRLAELKVAGCIIGRALYEGKLDLETVIRAVNS
jgi:phosphoribosylformimino-5-aminoimidazole carboxamide ribotide isomerase